MKKCLRQTLPSVASKFLLKYYKSLSPLLTLNTALINYAIFRLSSLSAHYHSFRVMFSGQWEESVSLQCTLSVSLCELWASRSYLVCSSAAVAHVLLDSEMLFCKPLLLQVVVTYCCLPVCSEKSINLLSWGINTAPTTMPHSAI